MDKLVRILLADDHLVVREGLRRLIECAGGMDVVGEAETGRGAVAQAVALRPDVVVMDISMPDLDGAQATRRIKGACPGTRVLALSVFEDGAHVHAALDAGVSGYVLKRSAGDELVDAIRAVSSGGVYLDQRIARKAVGRSGGGGPGKAGTPSLSEREAVVLRLIAEGYSNKEIAHQVGISCKTVETYKARSMEKLGLRSRVDIVQFANRAGWLAAQL
jgi:DNA-binding NarL/FixJ family response regulator